MRRGSPHGPGVIHGSDRGNQDRRELGGLFLVEHASRAGRYDLVHALTHLICHARLRLAWIEGNDWPC